MKWLKSTINALLISDKNNYLHEIDLRSFKIKQELLLSNTSPVGVLAPIIWQEDIRNPNNQAVFSPALSIVISRYRQSSTWENRRPHLACGAHHDPTIARSISTAEAIERSAAAAWQADSLDFGRLQDDPRRILPLTLIDLDQEQQKDAGLSPFEPQKSYYWRNAIDLIRGEEVQIIADLCYFPFDPPLHEYRFAWGNSSGMAAGRTLLEAQKSALLELIERDAFMVNWILKRSTPRIPHSLVPIDIRESQNQMESIGYRTSLLDITLRGVPTVLGIAYRSEWPAVILGAAARNTLLEAACAAWKEVEVGLYCRLIDPTMEENTKPLLEAKDVQGSEDHAKFFNHPCNMSLASFLWESKKETERPMDQPYFKDSDHQDIVSYCQQLNIDQMYMVDYGSMCGFEVVRLLTPNLVPLTFGYNQLPYRQVLHSSLLDIPSDVLSDVFPVHPFD